MGKIAQASAVSDRWKCGRFPKTFVPRGSAEDRSSTAGTVGESESAAEEGRLEQAGYLTASLASSFSVVLLAVSEILPWARRGCV